jgi:transcriptional regulator with XRE-family HTH domain
MDDHLPIPPDDNCENALSDPRILGPTIAQPKQKVRHDRLIEVAAFLRACRSRINPNSIGIAVGPRRRTSGLRRDEVAQRAGVSADWYTRIEQGRDVNPSPAVIDALADALILTDTERSHLRVLTGLDATLTTLALRADVSPGLERLIATLIDAPAYILNARWDILVANDAAKALFGSDWSLEIYPLNNLLYRFFTDPVFTRRLLDWDRHARLAIRQYRTVFARNLARADFAHLVTITADASADFSRWWTEADVAGRDDGRKEFGQPDGRTELVYDYVMLRSSGDAAVEVIAFLPSNSRLS